MSSTMLCAQETHSTLCQFELQGDRAEVTIGSHIRQVMSELCMSLYTL